MFKKSTIFISTFVLLILILTGCSSNKDMAVETSNSVSSSADYFGTGSYDMEYKETARDSIEPTKPSFNDGSSVEQEIETTEYNQEGYERKIIKNGELHIESNEPQEVENQIIELVNEYDGYIQSSSQYTRTEIFESQIDIRIPSEKFDVFLKNAKELGEVERVNVSTQDVTEEYIDLTARKETLEAQENRLVEMMDKAEKIEELLQIENELTRIRYEIERITGRLRYLENMTSFSTLQIYISEKIAPTKPEVNNVFEDIWFSFKDGVGTFFNVILGVVKSVAWSFPFLIILIPVIIIIYKRNLRRNKYN